MYSIVAYMNASYSKELEQFLEKIDGDDIEIHLYNHQEGETFDPSLLIAEAERITGEKAEACSLIFMTDIKNLMEAVYRVYHQVFQNFVFYSEKAEDIKLSHLFEKMQEVEWKEEEQLYKPIYCSSVHGALQRGEWKADLKEADDVRIRSEESAELLQKSYLIDGERYVFEPTLGTEVLIGEENGSQNAIHYAYAHNASFVDEMKHALKEGLFQKSIEMFDTVMRILASKKKTAYLQYNMTLLALREEFRQYEEDDKRWKDALYFYSYLLTEIPQRGNYDSLLRLIEKNADKLTEDELNCLCHQIDAVIFKHPYLAEKDSILRRLQEQLVERETKRYRKQLIKIPREERNKDEVIVITSQFLVEEHAPTKTALERIYTLGMELGKKVTVINAKEYMDVTGAIPLYEIKRGNVLPEYEECTTLPYKGYEFGFYQPHKSIREEEVVLDILNRVKEAKPEQVFYIGNFSVISELVAQIVPVIHIPVIFTKVFYKKNGCLVLGKHCSKKERLKMESLGYDMGQMIESTFTFELKKQANTWTRKELGLPEEKFLCPVIGLRLTNDVTQEFIRAMRPLFAHNVHFVFAGYMDHYDAMCRLFPELRENSTFVGFCGDVLALTEICDLYVNPKRLGGGFSIIESFIHKKPGITLDYGDVAGAAGPEFRVSSYEEMVETIIRYVEDKAFYESQAEKAYARAKSCIDSRTALEEIISKAKVHKSYY